MNLIFLYVIRHNLSHILQFFEHICISQNKDTTVLKFNQIRDHDFWS